MPPTLRGALALVVSYPTGFSAGVQSGDPLPGQIILWTRFQPSGDQSAKAAADPSNTAYTVQLPAGRLATSPSPSAGGCPPPTAAPALSPAACTPLMAAATWVVKLDVNYSTATYTQQQLLY
jgi:hypothetical protein